MTGISDCIRCSLAYDATAGHASARTHVDEIIRVRDYIKIMFDYYNCRPRSHQRVEHA